MGDLNYQHQALADGGWKAMPFALQMGNLGSEVSRSIKWADKNEKRFRVSFDRALELFDMTIDAVVSEPGKLKEVCRAREEFCDYFMGNSWHTDAVKMMRYYDQFALLARSTAE